MEVGHYWIKHNGFSIPARWDGELWHHEFGTSTAELDHANVHKDGHGRPVSIYSCPTGCTCHPNSDGSITVTCNP